MRPLRFNPMQQQHPLQQPAYPSESHQAMDKIQAELKSQRRLLEENHRMLLSVRRGMRFSFAASTVKLILILIPLILAAVFLPPFVRDWLETIRGYQEAIPDVSGDMRGINVDQLRELLQKSSLFER